MAPNMINTRSIFTAFRLLQPFFVSSAPSVKGSAAARSNASARRAAHNRAAKTATFSRRCRRSKQGPIFPPDLCCSSPLQCLLEIDGKRNIAFREPRTQQTDVSEEDTMFEEYRQTHDLLVDYAETLRDGSLPTFLKSLTRFEARHIVPAPHFWKAAEIVRVLNCVAFAEGITHPSLDLFISRVDAKIASRSKRAREPAHVKRRRGAPDQSK